METDVLDKIYGKRVVLYGCGRTGKNFYLQNTVYHLCDIVLLVDQNIGEIFGRKVYDKNNIGDTEYDYIVVTYFNEKTKENIEMALNDIDTKENIVYIHFSDMNFLPYIMEKENINIDGINASIMNKWVIDNFIYDDTNRRRNYYISEDKKIAYLRMAKCGCQTFSHCVNSLCEEPDNYISDREKCFLFTYTRNPFSRLVSCYLNKYKSKYWNNKNGGFFKCKRYLDGYLDEDEGFEIFAKKVSKIPDRLADEHFRSMYLTVYENGERIVDFVGKLEESNETFEEIRKKYDLPELKKLNVSSSYRWQDYYTLELAEIVYERYKEDFEYFGYEEEYAKLVEEIKNREK